jgi:hypothetical protein
VRRELLLEGPQDGFTIGSSVKAELLRDPFVSVRSVMHLRPLSVYFVVLKDIRGDPPPPSGLRFINPAFAAKPAHAIRGNAERSSGGRRVNDARLKFCKLKCPSNFGTRVYVSNSASTTFDQLTPNGHQPMRKPGASLPCQVG